MLSLAKTPRLSLKKASHNTQHVTLVQVYRSLVKQTWHIDSITAGFINAAVDLSHDCSFDANHSLITSAQYASVRDFVSLFYSQNYADLMAHHDSGLYFYHGWCGVGSDLFCTVAGHGVGFWEHETGKPLSDWLEDYGCEFYSYGDEDEGTLEGYACNMWKYSKA